MRAARSSETAQAKAGDTAKTVSVTVVHKDSVRRSVDVVGTLAAVDQVTISSEAEGKVSRILADLGDRVNAGQVLIQLDHEKQQYTSSSSRRRWRARSRSTARPTRSTCPTIEKTPDVQKAQGGPRAGEAGLRPRRASSSSGRSISQQALDDAQTALQSKQASYDSSLQNARNLRASIQASEATMKLAGRQLRDTEIRAPFDGYVEKRLVNLGELVKSADAGHGDRAPRSAEGDRRDAREDGAVDQRRPGRWSCTSTRIRTGRSPARCRVSARPSTPRRARFRSRRSSRTPDAVLKPGTFARVHIESGKVDDVLTLPYAALQYRYGVNRVFVVDGDRLAMRELQGRRAARRPHRDRERREGGERGRDDRRRDAGRRRGRVK